MTSDRDLLKRLQEWIDKTPEHEAKAALVLKGVGDTTIRQLLKGNYYKRPGPLLRRALDEILKEKAS